MDGEYIRALTELTQKLLNKEVNINKFHGYENEDINRWFEKLELVLDSKGIRLDVPAARTQLINNLAGPAETFMSELPPDERGDYNTGPGETGLDRDEEDKVTYFTEGLLQPLKTKVLEQMPETLMQAEEVARTVGSISQQETNTKESSQIERLTEAITRSQQVPAQATVTKSDKVAAYSEPQVGYQSKVEDLTELLKHMGNQMNNLEKRMDAHITGLTRTSSTRDTYH
ncbi:unnamed protein product [Porites evermanni]|uniref:Uncharacterized protein n=1 Tax=Porites evermanni TaxID=104178 RepID=A0ABN8MCS7_9CNID|nr:unnamed protein product [Porites evermanni]